MKILIVDDEEDIRDVVEHAFRALVENGEYDLAKTGNEAIALMKENNFDMIICDYNMPEGTGGDVFNYMIENNIKSKYVFCSSDELETKEEFKGREEFVFSEILKPDVFEGIEACLDKLESEGVNFEQNERDFCEVSIRLLCLHKELPANIFLKLSDVKSLKIFDKGQTFSDLDQQKYEKKNIEYFFVKREDIKLFLNSISKELKDILDDSEKPSTEKAFNIHEVIADSIKTFGMSDEFIESSKEIITETVDLILQDKVTSKKIKQLFRLKGSYLSKHSVGIAYIASGLLKNMIWDTHDTKVKVIKASFYHDLGVELIDFDESQTDPKSLEDHPIKAVEIIKKFEENTLDIEKIIMEHHERPDGSGFYRGLTASQFQPITALFVFSHMVVDVIFQLQRDNIEITYENVRDEINKFNYNFTGPFAKIVEAFENSNLFKD